MTWKHIRLGGAGGIARTCSVCEITEHRLPGGKFKVKVLERQEDFVALVNVCIRSDGGVPEWTCGLGGSELEALQDAVDRMMVDLETRLAWSEQDLEWSDPRNF